MNDNEIVYDLNLVTPEDKKKFDEMEKKISNDVEEIIEKLTNKIVKSDGTTEITWFIDCKHLMCEKEKAFYKVTKIISPNGIKSVNVERYLNTNMSSDMKKK